MTNNFFSSSGCYEVVETLGKGQTGQTILARAAASLVVIKQLYHPHDSLEVLSQRLKAMGQHSQLPGLLDSWETSDGQFFVFEHVLARPVDQAVPWSPAQIASFLLSLLPVLEHIHSFRLLHGDIRPINIRQTSGQHQQPILVDCRIAQQRTLGDAAYGAPEQALGKPVYASDLYSLGLVAVHLLTGLAPFELYSITDQRWIWPDLITKPVPPSLSKVLNKLLERSLDRRYTSASEALADLKESPRLIDKARSLLLKSESLPLQVAKKVLAAPGDSTALALTSQRIHWQPTYQFTPGIATALALRGQVLAMGTSTGKIFVGDLAHSAEIYTLEGDGHCDRITALAFHPQVRTLYSASSDGTVKQWSLATGQLEQTLSQPGWQPTDLAVAPPYLAVSDSTGHIGLWHLKQLTPYHRFNQHQDWVSAISASNHRLASISRDRTLRIWSLPDKRLLETLSIGPSQGLALHPTGNHAIVGNNQGQIDVWHLANPTSKDRLCTVDHGITALVLSPDARLLAVGTDGNVLKIYQGVSGQCVSELAQGWGVVAIAFDGHTLVSSSQDETVTVWQRAVNSMP
ncbi:MAG: hypothetical protein AAGI69_00380 [Cyanobacteria bacterium P01_H01_bin.21]